MDVHRAPQDGVGRLGVHDVQDAVNGLVTARTQDRGAQNLPARRVDQNLHGALCLALFDRARHLVIGRLPIKAGLPCFRTSASFARARASGGSMYSA